MHKLCNSQSERVYCVSKNWYQWQKHFVLLKRFFDRLQNKTLFRKNDIFLKIDFYFPYLFSRSNWISIGLGLTPGRKMSRLQSYLILKSSEWQMKIHEIHLAPFAPIRKDYFSWIPVSDWLQFSANQSHSKDIWLQLWPCP